MKLSRCISIKISRVLVKILNGFGVHICVCISAVKHEFNVRRGKHFLALFEPVGHVAQYVFYSNIISIFQGFQFQP